MKVAIVGGGVMGEAILAAALDKEIFDPAGVTVVEKLDARRTQLRAAYGVDATADASAVAEAALVLLAVKPQDVATVRAAVHPRALLMSIMAGVPIGALEQMFGHKAVVRVMPNTPAAVKAGMSVWTASPEVNAAQRDLARTVLAAVGRELYVDDEKKIDMATAISGSGPAYVFLFIEAMVEAGVAVGLPRLQAEEMALQTVYGSALYALEGGRPAAELRAMVTSPAGTTAAALLEFEKGAFRATVIEAAHAAHRRAIELGEGR